jgi:hypothetical protein
LARAKLTGLFIDAIGAPITQETNYSGNTNVKWSGRRSESLDSLSGPKDKARLYLKTDKPADLRSFHTLVAKVDQPSNPLV